mmetsp:Transcript_11757/g.28115  ORF Transcript_11757/g.28115 Transcript_11757/m.28115 type:complete len:140 (-) Transcript_11757:375-794(-)
MPPARVRHLFRTLDADGNGTLSLEELLSGFEKEFGNLRPHAKDAVFALFEAHASDEGNGKGLKIGKFNRFYAEILFKHFDADNNGTLQAEEAQEALKFLMKPAAGQPQASVAFPPTAYNEAGELQLPFSWFWTYYQAMD